MKPTIKTLVCTVLVACTACNKNNTEGSDDSRIDVPVQFGTGTDLPATRGLNPMVGDGIYSIGVFAGYEEESESFNSESPAADYIENARYSRVVVSNPLTGEDVCYWPFKGKLSFFSYSPYLSVEALRISPDYSKGFPRMIYVPNQNVSEQPDFCIANPVLNKHMTTEPIPLKFHHSLSQIVFSANYLGDIPAAYTLKVDEIMVCDVIGSKEFEMDATQQGFHWQPDASCGDETRTNYTLTRTTDYSSQIINVGIPKSNGSNFQEISTQAGIMYLIPQSMTSGQVYLQVTCGFYQSINGKETLISQFTSCVNLPATTWEIGKRYRYYFSLDEATSGELKASVSIEPWKDSGNLDAEHYVVIE